MAICPDCKQEMLEADSCTFHSIISESGKVYDRHRFMDAEDEAMYRNLGIDYDFCESSIRCGDCGIRPGGLHHFGCDMERCPRCGGQLISCDCWWEGDRFAILKSDDGEIDIFVGKE